MTHDLRDQLADFEAAARRLLTQPRRLVLVHATPATCHPDRPVAARGLCKRCYDTARDNGTLHQHPHARTPQRSRADFVADYELLRSEGYPREQIAERLGMTPEGLRSAYRRAVAAGDLRPDRRPA